MTKLNRFGERLSHMKIRKKLFLLILAAGALCLTVFRFLWYQKWNVYYFMSEHIPARLQIIPMPENDFWIRLNEEAKKYDIPKSEDDEEAVKAMEPFFELADEYTGIAIYGLEDGLYRASCTPSSMLWDQPFQTFFQLAYHWVDEDVNQNYSRPVQFKNGYASVIISFYHSSYFLVPYGVFCLCVCVFLFLFAILFFVGKKLKVIVRLEEAVLQMSAGDLTTAVPKAGFDEVGILALELDQLRMTLHENFTEEQKVHQSNQELIAALSHDLRTPLTILKGYLEILRLNRNPDMHAEYIGRCMAKADDLKEMTDRMFEYALVFDETADAKEELALVNMPAAVFLDSLQEHADFLRLAGFTVEFGNREDTLPSPASAVADETILKRVLNNLFSNIIKYADKKEAVSITVASGEAFVISASNRIRDLEDDSYDNVESTQIGLKSVKKMMEKINGGLTVRVENGVFCAELRFQSGAAGGEN